VIGSYRLAKRHRGIVYIAGHVSMRLNHSDLIRGKVEADLTLKEACEAALVCALHMLSTLRIETGSLDQVACILKVFGMVNVAPGFVQLAKVMDGCRTSSFRCSAKTPEPRHVHRQGTLLTLRSHIRGLAHPDPLNHVWRSCWRSR